MTETQVFPTFYRPCTNCGKTIEVVDGTEQTHDCDPHPDMGVTICRSYWAGHDRAKTDVAAPLIDGSTSDGFHTFDELYRFRLLYNAALFNEWARATGIETVRSWRHHEGDECFGGGWFIVMAKLPTGQISNHYRAADWDLFYAVDAQERAWRWDGHTAADVASRLAEFLVAKP